MEVNGTETCPLVMVPWTNTPAYLCGASVKERGKNVCNLDTKASFNPVKIGCFST
jgi:hypothetical protein